MFNITNNLQWNPSNFVTSYLGLANIGLISDSLGIPLYLTLIFGYKILKRSKRIAPAQADLITGKARIGSVLKDFNVNFLDQDEQRYLAERADEPHGKGVPSSRIYGELTLFL